MVIAHLGHRLTSAEGSPRPPRSGCARKVGILFPGELGAQREKLIAEGLANELGSEA